MTTPLVDPQLAAFWASNPSILPQQPPPVYTPEEHKPDLAKVAAELGAAFVLMHFLISRDLLKTPPPVVSPREFALKAWTKYSPIWLRLSVAAVQQGYELGRVADLNQDDLEAMAQSYAEDLGDYVNQTSADALVQGFQDQLQNKWSESLAWHRAASAYGLDSQQMRAYVRGPIASSAEDSAFQQMPKRAQEFITRAIAQRALRLGGHEAWQSMEMGKALGWLVQERQGLLPTDAQKEWLTAEDERVCPECAPLDHKRVGLDEQFETPSGNKYWAPGVHPNCRCDIKLVYPEIRTDVWQSVVKAEDEETRRRASRDQPREHGRFGERPQQQRAAAPQPQARPYAEPERPPTFDPVYEEFMRQARELAQQEQELEQKIAPSPFGRTTTVKSPFGGKQTVASPFSEQVSRAAPSPFTAAGKPSPFAAEVAQVVRSPFQQMRDLIQASPFRTARPSRRLLVVLFPNGETQEVTREEYEQHPDEFEDAQITRYHVWAKDWLKDAEGIESAEIADGQDFLPGTIVSFDHKGPFSGNTTIATKEPDNLDVMFTRPQNFYGSDEFYEAMQYGAQAARRELANQYTALQEQVSQNFEGAVNELAERRGGAELRRVLNDAGVHFKASAKIDQLRDEIVSRKGSENMRHALVQRIADRAPDLFGREDTQPGMRIQKIEQDLADIGVYQRTPQVFILEDLAPDTAFFTDPSQAVLSGNYKVVDNVFRSSAVQMGDERPANIKGVRFVYLTPTEPNAGEEPTAEELAELERRIAFDRKGMAYDVDNPPPDIMRRRGGFPYEDELEEFGYSSEEIERLMTQGDESEERYYGTHEDDEPLDYEDLDEGEYPED